jgi:Fe-S cluster biogenesis protein NfuA
MSTANLQQLSANIEDLVQKIEAIADPEIRADVLTLVRSVMELHGTGLKRILDLVSASGETGRHILTAVADDDLAGSLLLLHGLHPADVEERIAKAVERASSQLRSHGASAKLLAIEDGVLRIRIEQSGHGSGCGSTAALQHIVEEYIYAAAPEIVSITFDNLAAPAPLVQLSVTGIAPARA